MDLQFLARKDEIFSIVTSEFADRRLIGPLVATQDIHAQETAMAFGEWLAANDDEAVDQLIYRTLNADSVPIDGNPFFAEQSTAYAAWLIEQGLAKPVPSRTITVSAIRTSDETRISVEAPKTQESMHVTVRGPAPGPK